MPQSADMPLLPLRYYINGRKLLHYQARGVYYINRRKLLHYRVVSLLHYRLILLH